MSRLQWGTVGEHAGAVFGLVAIVVSLVLFAVQRDDLARQQDQVDQLTRERFAIYVDLGEVQIEDYQDNYLVDQLGPPPEGDIWWAVYNANPVAIRRVWVEGPNDQFVWIDEIQRCTYYVLGSLQNGENLEFDPTAVHFIDPQAGWHRSAEGRVFEGYSKPPRPTDQDNGRAYIEPLDQCTS